MIGGILLFSQPFDLISNSQAKTMKDSTDKFIELMRQRYGPEEKVGRGNVLNFGGQVTFAIGNSKLHGKGNFFYAIQSDLLELKRRKNPTPPLGIHAALVCGDEQTVLVLPQKLVSEAMKNSPTDRINFYLRDQKYYMQATNYPKTDVTQYLNKYPEPLAKDETPPPVKEIVTPPEQQESEFRDHTRIQWMLIRFGRAAGYSVWVPPSDRNQKFDSEGFADLTISELPNFGFDAITSQIVSNIDVLWFEGNVIHKAFEIESTTSIYSGLLRMSDLVLSQPNINIDLHIVAPSRRRDLVRKNILRPTFSRLRPKCSYITFEEVTAKYAMVKDILRQQQAQMRDLLESERF
jgi:hypothetical protein